MASALTKLESELYELAKEFPGLRPSATSPGRFTSFCPIHGKDKTSDVEWELDTDDSVVITCKVCGLLSIDDIRNPPKTEAKQSTSIIELPIDSITADTRAQSRAEIDMALVAEYAELMREGAIFPPLTVLHDGSTHWLSEGFHRIHAYRETAFLTIPCIVKQGGLREAILLSVGSNTDHGKRRSNADKRRSVELLLKDTLWTSWSDREIAKQCAVSHELVRQARAICQPLTDTDSTEMVRTATRNGTTYTVNVGNIGAKVKTDKELKDKEETESIKPDYDDAAYVKKAQDDASLDSFYKFSEIAASFCNEKNANFLKNLLIKHSEYYRDRWRRPVKDSISNVMTFLDNKHFYMKALDEVLFEIVPHYEKRVSSDTAEKTNVFKFPCEPVGSPYSPPGTHGFVMLRSSLLQNSINMMKRYGIDGVVKNLRELLFNEGERINDDSQLPWNLFPDVKNPVSDPVKYFEMLTDMPWDVIIKLIRLADNELANELLRIIPINDDNNEIDQLRCELAYTKSMVREVYYGNATIRLYGDDEIAFDKQKQE